MEIHVMHGHIHNELAGIKKGGGESNPHHSSRGRKASTF